MDRELDQYFEDYDLEKINTESQYRRQSETVANQFEKKLEDATGKIRFAQDVVALFRFFRDADVPWQKKAIVVAALLYFIIPFDSIPDIAPFVGYLDDMGVILAVNKFMGAETSSVLPHGAGTPAINSPAPMKRPFRPTHPESVRRAEPPPVPRVPFPPQSHKFVLWSYIVRARRSGASIAFRLFRLSTANGRLFRRCSKAETRLRCCPQAAGNRSATIPAPPFQQTDHRCFAP
jgi:uncharacterized membrane protein YkvA (DUF1232 family)